MFQDTEWKPGDATKLAKFHQQFAPDIEAARPCAKAPLVSAYQLVIADMKASLKPNSILFPVLEAGLEDAQWAMGTSDPLPLATPVCPTTLGVDGVITAHSSCDSSRYQVSWFNRHFWAVRHEWVSRGVIEVLKQTTALA